MTLAGLRQRPAFLLYRFLWITLDWVFPPYCAGCGVLGERWCPSCRQSLTLLIPPLCSRCGVPLPGNISTNLCRECSAIFPCFTLSRSVCAYTGAARKAVHRLKYGREIGIGEALSIHMLQLLNSLSWSIDMVTCVPLSKARIQQRGYNQAALLARPIALGLCVPFRPLLLRKTREVPSQVGLSSQDRRRNVEDAFESGRMLHSSSRILVIDDVFTTGSTMNACARALYDAGAQQIYGLTFARAGLSDHNQPI